MQTMKLKETDVDRMVAVMRHRLRNHISGLQSGLSLLQDEISRGTPTSLKEYVPLLLKECALMDEQVCRFGSALQPRLEWGPDEIERVAEKAVTKVRDIVPFTAMEVRCDDAAELKTAYAGPLECALVEILKNAVEADRKGAVDLVCKRAGKATVSITVADKGPGVKKADLKKIFLPFYTTKSKHMGLGLAIASNMISGMGGSVCAQKEKPGLKVEIMIPVEGPARKH